MLLLHQENPYLPPCFITSCIKIKGIEFIQIHHILSLCGGCASNTTTITSLLTTVGTRPDTKKSEQGRVLYNSPPLSIPLHLHLLASSKACQLLTLTVIVVS
jgi:hypothetical protein